MKRIIFLILIFGFLWSQGGEAPEDTTKPQKKELGVEEIKAKAALKIRDAQKPPLQITPDVFSPIDSVVQAMERQVTFKSVSVVEKAIDQSVVSQSNVIRVPAESSLIQTDIKIPLPKIKKKKISKWELTIVNSLGLPVSSLTGTGKPPNAVSWDGKMASGDLITPMEPYNYRLLVIAEDGTRRQFLGKPFKVIGFATSDNEGYKVRFNLNKIFRPQSADLQQDAEKILTDILNHIKQNFTTAIIFRIYSSDPYLMETRKKAIMNFLNKNMELGQGTVQFEPKHITGSKKYEMIEFVTR